MRVVFLSFRRLEPLGTVQLRCLQPIEYLKSNGVNAIASYLYSGFLPEKDDIIILCRAILDDYTKRLIEYSKSLGCPIIYDVDDLLFSQSSKSYLDRIGQHNNAKDIDLCRSAMQICDAVSVSTSYLLEKAANINSNVYLLRNAISKDYLRLADLVYQQRIKSSVVNKSVTLAYLSGSSTHEHDFKTIEEVLFRILENYTFVNLTIVGFLNISSKFNVFGNRVVAKEFVPYKDFAKLFLNIDINLVPLSLTEPFCQGKSELKYIEAGICAVPSVVSATDTHKDVITHDIDGMLASSEDEWFNCLVNLVESRDRRVLIGKMARQKVITEYSEEARTLDWFNFFKNIRSIRRYRKGVFIVAYHYLLLKLSFVYFKVNKELKRHFV